MIKDDQMGQESGLPSSHALHKLWSSLGLFLQTYELISSLNLHELLQLNLAERCGQAGLAIDTKHDGEDIKFNVLTLSHLKQHLHIQQPIQGPGNSRVQVESSIPEPHLHLSSCPVKMYA